MTILGEIVLTLAGVTVLVLLALCVGLHRATIDSTAVAAERDRKRVKAACQERAAAVGESGGQSCHSR